MITKEEPCVCVRPQPVGIFAGPSAALLLPSVYDFDHTEALTQLLSGCSDKELPAAWEFYRAANAGDVEQAIELLRNCDSRAACDEYVRDYNLFALNPTAEGLAELRSRFTGELLALLEVAAFSAGLVSELPDQFNLDGELLAWGLASAATSAIERDDYVAARRLLLSGVEAAQGTSPLLEAILIAQAAQVAQNCADVSMSLIQQEYDCAIKIAAQHHLPGFVGELWAQLGIALQQTAEQHRERWLGAIRAYQSALQTGVQPESRPRLFAELHNNLGLAYLSVPSNESSLQLRVGIAIQSFRTAIAALEDSLDHPGHDELWARTSMNLANALQYAPSSHPESNLIQAVEIYEQVLTVRSRARDPVAFALVMLNQANALAHLGIFKPALEKAAEAYKLFQWHNQSEQAVVARELVERVNDALAAKYADTATQTTPNQLEDENTFAETTK